jgi:hypothetical protein
MHSENPGCAAGRPERALNLGGSSWQTYWCQRRHRLSHRRRVRFQQWRILEALRAGAPLPEAAVSDPRAVCQVSLLLHTPLSALIDRVRRMEALVREDVKRYGATPSSQFQQQQGN